MQILLIFVGPLYSRYFWNIRLKICRLPNTLSSVPLLKSFFKQIVFVVFTESWSSDQLLQKAYRGEYNADRAA